MLNEILVQQQQNFSDYYWRNYVTVLEIAENVARTRIPLDAHILWTDGRTDEWTNKHIIRRTAVVKRQKMLVNLEWASIE